MKIVSICFPSSTVLWVEGNPDRIAVITKLSGQFQANVYDGWHTYAQDRQRARGKIYSTDTRADAVEFAREQLEKVVRAW